MPKLIRMSQSGGTQQGQPQRIKKFAAASPQHEAPREPRVGRVLISRGAVKCPRFGGGNIIRAAGCNECEYCHGTEDLGRASVVKCAMASPETSMRDVREATMGHIDPRAVERGMRQASGYEWERQAPATRMQRRSFDAREYDDYEDYEPYDVSGRAVRRAYADEYDRGAFDPRMRFEMGRLMGGPDAQELRELTAEMMEGHVVAQQEAEARRLGVASRRQAWEDDNSKMAKKLKGRNNEKVTPSDISRHRIVRTASERIASSPFGRINYDSIDDADRRVQMFRQASENRRDRIQKAKPEYGHDWDDREYYRQQSFQTAFQNSLMLGNLSDHLGGY